MTDKENNAATNYIKMEYKAYGAYRGSHDGGGVSNTLYWNISLAKEECLKDVAEINKETKRMLQFSLKDAKKSKQLINHAKEMYKPMVETNPNYWTNGMDEVMIKEFDIK